MTDEKDDDEISFDLKKVKSFFKNLIKQNKTKQNTDQENNNTTENEENSTETTQTKKKRNTLNLKKVWQFILKYKILLLLLIPLLVSIHFRIIPLGLPIADEWAENSVHSNIKAQISQQLNQQYPHLPDAQKKTLLNDHFNEFLKENKGLVETQTKQVSETIREYFKDEKGDNYLGDIDTWVWLGYAKNYLNYGHYGNEIINGDSWYTLRNGREGQKAFSFNLFVFSIIVNHKIMNLFGDFSVMASNFFAPVFWFCFAVIGAFFVGLKIGGPIGALTASLVIALHTSLLSRIIGGVNDTDLTIAVFSIFAVMFFILALFEKKRAKQITFIILAGLSMALYAIDHNSWWHIFDFIIGAFGLYFLFYAWSQKNTIKKNIKSFFKLNKTKELLTLFFGFIISSWILGAFLKSLLLKHNFFQALKDMIIQPITGPLWFIEFKDVGIKSIWPNVMITVAELKTMKLSEIVSAMGGNLLFVLSIIGILFLFFKKQQGERKFAFIGFLLALWYIGTIYACQNSIRFTALLAPGFAFGLAAFVSSTYTITSKWLNKGLHINRTISKSIVLLILFFIVFPPMLKAANAVALRSVPLMNDIWYDSLIGIKNDCEDGIITSWWDYGHWFVTVAERKVTFDGGNQGERIHWVGKSLLTENETMTIGLLKMLNCGQQKAPHVLEKYLDNDTVKAIEILNEIIVVEKEQAKTILKKNGLTDPAIKEVLETTHCEDLLPQYFIVSEDMIGKAGVWGHFGSWDFKKASMYNKVYGTTKDNGTNILIKEFNLTSQEADKIFYEIQNEDSEHWISSWPGFLGSGSCSVKNNTATCTGLSHVETAIIDLETHDAIFRAKQGTGIPHSIVYADETGIREKILKDSTSKASILLVPEGTGFTAILASPEQAMSMFSRLYFFKGHGLKCFELLSYKAGFTGTVVFVYKVDWSCNSEILIEEYKKLNIKKTEDFKDIINETENTQNNLETTNNTEKIDNNNSNVNNISENNNLIKEDS